MKMWSEPSPSDWERWENLLGQGRDPSDAAHELGYTSSAFRRCDRERHALLLEMSRDVRAGQDRQLARDTLREVAADGGQQGSTRVQAATQLGRAAGMFDEHVRVELTGQDGGPVEIQGGVGLDEVVGVLLQVGAVSAGELVSAAGEVLAESADV